MTEEKPTFGCILDVYCGMIATVEDGRITLDGYGKHWSRVGNLPGVLGELPSAVLADEITTPGPGQVRALAVTAGNPVLSTANGPGPASAMRQLECSVALDFYVSETASLATHSHAK